MKVTVIGQWGGFPKVCEASSGYLIQEDGFNLVIDFGSAVLSNLQRYIKIEEIDAVVLSHYHHDHVADIGPLQYARLVNYHMGKSLNTIPIYGHGYDEGGFTKLSMEPYTKGAKYTENDMVNIGPFTMKFCRTKHPVPCFAMRISSKDKTIVYTADTAYTKELVEFSKGVDLLICECNLYANQDGSNMGHMSSKDAGTLAKAAGVKKLLLTHLPHYGDLSMLVKEAKDVFEGKVELATLGWVFES